MVADAERGAGGGQFGDAVPAELVGLGGGELASAGTWISPSSPRVQVTSVTWAPSAA